MAVEEELGPIDVVVIGFPKGAPMTGDAVPIFLDLVNRGIIRVFDALFVRKDEDGTFSGFDLSDLDAGTAGDLTVFAARRPDCWATTTPRWPQPKSSPGARP